mmetsp:Transcript_45100/g.97993  ORF Transcript_45100/g.97993 Transcript_45100/m.97993 type:complete len:240 (+) Transcript_45100:113-832(+)
MTRPSQRARATAWRAVLGKASHMRRGSSLASADLQRSSLRRRLAGNRLVTLAIVLPALGDVCRSPVLLLPENAVHQGISALTEDRHEGHRDEEGDNEGGHCSPQHSGGLQHRGRTASTDPLSQAVESVVEGAILDEVGDGCAGTRYDHHAQAPHHRRGPLHDGVGDRVLGSHLHHIGGRSGVVGPIDAAVCVDKLIDPFHELSEALKATGAAAADGLDGNGLLAVLVFGLVEDEVAGRG